MMEAKKGFRRLMAYKQLPTLSICSQTGRAGSVLTGMLL